MINRKKRFSVIGNHKRNPYAIKWSYCAFFIVASPWLLSVIARLMNLSGSIIGAVYLLPMLGSFVWMILNTITDFRKSVETEPAIKYSGWGLLIYSLSILLFFGVISMFVDVNYNPRLYLFIFFPLSASVYFLIVYYSEKNRSSNLKLLESLIFVSHITSLDKMAEISGMKVNKCIKYINFLINLGHLKDTKVEDGEVLFKKCLWAKQKIICKDCGGENTVNIGQDLVCDYCGSALFIKSI
ncbi:MAG: hypothetical protein K5761_03900 [Clostridiales bacterium]|nr:hypothetical protein [Clostridiales bacterium]